LEYKNTSYKPQEIKKLERWLYWNILRIRWRKNGFETK
jgi:hypothetical protein